MNLEHLRAFFWMHWRLRMNQMYRSGIANKVLMTLVVVSLTISSVVFAIIAFVLAAFTMHLPSPIVMLYIWDGITFAFLFFWMLVLLAELQRTEALALNKFLHLPVSLGGVFVLNYLSSLINVNLLLIVPAMFAFSLGTVIARGPFMLLMIPLLLSFLLMVTALTYQFQGWLAALMVDKRRRRTVIVVATIVVVLLAQLPNLINFLRPWDTRGGKEHQLDYTQEQIETAFYYGNAVLPPGWLPFGAMAAAEGNVVPALLATLAFTLVGAVSLWRGYRTTLRIYTGEFTAGTAQPLPVEPPQPAETPTPAPTATASRSVTLLEKTIPWLSEEATAIALSSFRSLTRAPEARMMLLSPIILLVLYGVVFARNSQDVPGQLRLGPTSSLAGPVFGFAAMGLTLFTVMSLIGNQFGYDRSGFRIYVLSPVPRREVLLGKNLGLVPLLIALVAPALLFVRLLCPMHVTHLLAFVPQFVSMFLLVCLLANVMSIIAPMAVAAGSMRPANPRITPFLIHLGMVFLLPIVLGPTLLPLAIELTVEELSGIGGIPIHLLLSLLICGIVIFLYRVVITWQGNWLQSREQRILEMVTTRAE